MSFWKQLTTPIIGLSPMDGITDHPYRHITKKYGQPHLVYTEFTSVEGLGHGATRILKDYIFDETQRPIIGQVYGTTPKFFRQAAVLLCELGFDGIDINMGCPAKNVAHSGAGAALIQTPKLAQEIIRATQAGVQDWLNGKRSRDCEDLVPKIWQEAETRHKQLPQQFQERRAIPISVKTRVGYNEPIVHDWISQLLETNISAIALHGRTLSQHYGGQASWELIGEAALLAKNTETLLLGNGDISTYQDAINKIQTFGTAGALIGRASFGNPHIFLPHSTPPTLKELVTIAFEHAQLFEKTYQNEEKYSFLPMRKHLGWYIHTIPNAAKIRQEIYQTNSSNEFWQIVEKYQLNETTSS